MDLIIMERTLEWFAFSFKTFRNLILKSVKAVIMLTISFAVLLAVNQPTLAHEDSGKFDLQKALKDRKNRIAKDPEAVKNQNSYLKSLSITSARYENNKVIIEARVVVKEWYCSYISFIYSPCPLIYRDGMIYTDYVTQKLVSSKNIVETYLDNAGNRIEKKVVLKEIHYTFTDNEPGDVPHLYTFAMHYPSQQGYLITLLGHETKAVAPHSGIIEIIPFDEDRGDQEVTTITEIPSWEIMQLECKFKEMVNQKINEGYLVLNPTLIEKAWNYILLKTRMLDATKARRCGKFAEWGIEWSKDFVKIIFGKDAIVDEIFIEERTSAEEPKFFEHPLDWLDSKIPANHRATRVILPNGERYMLDYWQWMGRSKGEEPRLLTEKEWIKQWKKEIGEDDHVIQRSPEEQSLKLYIKENGEKEGMKFFMRSYYKKTGNKALIILKSWRKNPW